MEDIKLLLDKVDILELENLETIQSTDLEKNRAKVFVRKSFNNSNFLKKGILVASLITIILTTIIVKNPTMANGIPIIGGPISRMLINNNRVYLDYLDYKNKKVSIDGIDLTLESVLVASDDLYMNFIVKNNNREITMEDYKDILTIGMFTEINGKKGEGDSLSHSFQFIDKNTIAVSNKLKLKSPLEGNVRFRIPIEGIMESKGDYSLEFTYNVGENKITKKECEPNIIYGNDFKTNIKKIQATPFDVEIIYETSNYPSSMSPRILVFDDNGRILVDNGMEGIDGTNFKLSYKAKGETNGLTLVPIVLSEEQEKMIINGEHKEKNVYKTIEIDINEKKGERIYLNESKDRYIEIFDYYMEGDVLVIKYAPYIFGMNASGFFNGDDISIVNVKNDGESVDVDKYKDLNYNYEFAVGKVDGNKAIINVYYGSELYTLDNAIKIEF